MTPSIAIATSRLHLEQGVRESVAGRFEAALAHFDRALEINPTYGDAILERANELVSLNRFNEAIGVYEQFLHVCAQMAFRTTLETIPASVPYLSADGERVAYWQRRLGQKSKLRVGLAWWTGTARDNDPGNGDSRNVPLSELVQALPSGCEYYSLQRHARDCDRSTLGTTNIVQLEEDLDLEDTAAVMHTMDLVVSIDTSLAHLSGALAKLTWMLLPYVTDWRWQPQLHTSPWYPTMRLYRQQAFGDWREALQRVGADLREMCAGMVAA